jgi:hypothetical protein
VKLYTGDFESAIDLLQRSVKLDPLHADDEAECSVRRCFTRATRRQAA